MFHQVFEHAPEGRKVGDHVMPMPQGDQRVVEFGLDFCTLAVESVWNEPAFIAVFRCGLNDDVLTELACQDDEATLDLFIDMVIGVDNVLNN